MEKHSFYLPESRDKHPSVASVMQSVKNGCNKAMDRVMGGFNGFKGFGKAAALATVLATASGCADHDDKKTPPSAVPTDPTTTALASARQEDKKLAQALVGIFPSDEKSPSALVSINPQEIQSDFSQWRESQKTPHVAPTSATFGPETIKNGDSTFMLTENNSWTLFPPKEVRYDIGEDKIITVAKKEDHSKKPQKKERPHSDAQDMMAGRESDEMLAPQAMTEQETLKMMLKKLRKESPQQTIAMIDKMVEDGSVQLSVEQIVGKKGRLLGTQLLQKITRTSIDMKPVEGISLMTYANFESTFKALMTAGFSDTPKFAEYQANANGMIDAINKIGWRDIKLKTKIIDTMTDRINTWLLNSLVEQDLHDLARDAYHFAMYENGIGETKAKFAPAMLNSIKTTMNTNLPEGASVLKCTFSDGRVAYIPTHEQSKYIRLGKNYTGASMLALNHEALEFIYNQMSHTQESLPQNNVHTSEQVVLSTRRGAAIVW